MSEPVRDLDLRLRRVDCGHRRTATNETTTETTRRRDALPHDRASRGSPDHRRFLDVYDLIKPAAVPVLGIGLNRAGRALGAW